VINARPGGATHQADRQVANTLAELIIGGTLTSAGVTHEAGQEGGNEAA
jgi:hypothetical protein